jgi:hypothetical protein
MERILNRYLIACAVVGLISLPLSQPMAASSAEYSGSSRVAPSPGAKSGYVGRTVTIPRPKVEVAEARPKAAPRTKVEVRPLPPPTILD